MYNEADLKESANKIESAKFPIIFAPFHGTPVPVMVQKLTQAQIMACGNFSLIETFEDKIRRKKKPTRQDIIAYSERNNEIVKAALINPTYEKIFEIIGHTPIAEKSKKILKELKIKLGQVKGDAKRRAIEEEIDAVHIWTNYLLPSDFTAYITSFVLGIDESDIKTISENMLLEVAILAERGHDNPADHIDGKFTPFMRDDINNRAWYLLTERRKEMKGHAR